MCIIAVKTPESHITKRALHTAWGSNPDGGGFAYTYHNTLVVEKGFFVFRKFYKALRLAEEKAPDSNFLIHMRIASSGDVNGPMTHPFLVHNRLAFAHNGVLSIEIPENSKLSDTAIFCESVLKRLPKYFLEKSEFSVMLEMLAKGNFSKFVFLSASNVVTIFNESIGHWLNGIWYSNDSYTTRKSYSPVLYAGYGLSGDADVDERIQCDYCGAFFPASELEDTVAGTGYYRLCPACSQFVVKDSNVGY